MSFCSRNDHINFSVNLRKQLADNQVAPVGNAQSNNDETDVSDFVAIFTKAFAHDNEGVVKQMFYKDLINALDTCDIQKLDRVKLANKNGSNLANPQAAFSFNLFGPDSYSIGLESAPKFTSPETAGEMVELYEKALARDINFNDYDSSPKLNDTLDSLNALTDFRGPKQNGKVTRSTLFRGNSKGDLKGPYISQFLLLDFKIGDTFITQRYSVPFPKTTNPNVEFMRTFDKYLSVQNGSVTETEPARDSIKRYIRNGRDLAAFVHSDNPIHDYVHAASVLNILGCPINPGIPYAARMTNQDPFGTLGILDLVDVLGRAITYAIKAAWYFKWRINRRLRPEAFGAEVEKVRLGNNNIYGINSDVLNSTVLQRLLSDPNTNGNYLLAQTYPEGSPVHPAYPAGHATIAGACVTVLKAFFDGSFMIPQTKTTNSDGTALVNISDKLTVNDELDKLASNISLGRDFAGVHYRSDVNGIELGEEIAIRILKDLVHRYTEENVEFILTKRNGDKIKISK